MFIISSKNSNNDNGHLIIQPVNCLLFTVSSTQEQSIIYIQYIILLHVHMSLPIILYYISSVITDMQVEDKITCVAVIHSNSITTTLNGISISQCLSGVCTGKHRKSVFLHCHGYREFRSLPWGPRHGLRLRSCP